MDPNLKFARDLLGESDALRDVVRLIDRVGPTAAHVLISGEAGVGKECAARAIHARSARAQKDFVVFSCGAVPPGLMEAELFGYEKNSFVGAERAHIGALERAQGGTLLLDEIIEMPLDIQGRLLRAIDTKKFYRMGSITESPLDVRIVATSVLAPRQAVKTGRMREEMLYRLAFVLLAIPALRDRNDDAVHIAARILSQLNAASGSSKVFSEHSMSVLKEHGWPGNTRELRTCIERAFLLADESLELVPLVAAFESEGSGISEKLDIRVGASIDEVERSLIEATLQHFRGNKRRAADTLGCSLKTLYNKLHGYSQAAQGLVNS